MVDVGEEMDRAIRRWWADCEPRISDTVCKRKKGDQRYWSRPKTVDRRTPYERHRNRSRLPAGVRRVGSLVGRAGNVA